MGDAGPHGKLLDNARQRHWYTMYMHLATETNMPHVFARMLQSYIMLCSAGVPTAQCRPRLCRRRTA